MSDTNKQSPLGVNALNSYLNAQGLTINPPFTGYVGTSHDFPSYTMGTIVGGTVLRMLTYAINQAYNGNADGIPTANTYYDLITIGAGYTTVNITSINSGIDPGTDNIYFKVTYNSTATVTVTSGSYVNISGVTPNGYNGSWLVESVGSDSPGTNYFRVAVSANYGSASTPGTFTADTQVPALGNAKALTYTWEKMIGPYGTGTFNLGDVKGWGGSLYKNNLAAGNPTSSAETANPATQWGYNRLLALQAWMEFNYNSTLEEGDDTNPAGYRDFLQSFTNASGFISYSNSAILPVDNSKTFLDGAYSNMNDLISGDITGISLATKAFGQDLITLGKALNLSTIATFGLPSNLLKTLVQNNALTQNLSLAIIATGINTNELGAIISNLTPPTIEQEQKLYAAFFITVGSSLDEVLVPLNCKTQGLESLADLLNPQKLFPNSYNTLTVPIYNTTTQPTNSKTYYPIYVDGGVNANLTSPGVLSQIGIQTPVGTPPISNNTNVTITVQEPTVGFGSYLSTIVPPSIATACGALSATFLQVKNITNVPIEKFAQVVTNLETIVGLPVNGTNVPTNLDLRTAGRPLIALGSGPQGTYTASDFFGCMSGLPYNGPLKNIQAKLQQLQTTKLFNIYHELYLAVTWQHATVSVQYSTYQVESPPTVFTTYYHVTGVTLTSPGGGYGRGSAVAPIITIGGGSGATAVATIGTDDTNIVNFGRVVTATLTSSGTDVTTPPTITIECPPTASLPVQSNGNRSTSGTNTASGTTGWPTMNTIIQGYIDQANTEINSINSSNKQACQSLNDSWNATGTQLTVEQRARQVGLNPPLADVRENYMSLFPTTVYNFVDSIAQYAKNTQPNMYAQTLENISDLQTPGGQSAVASMRQQRNQDRLTLLGIPLDNNIPDTLPYDQQKALIANGTLPTGTANPNIPGGTGTAPTIIPNPAQTNSNGNVVTTEPIGVYDPATDNYLPTDPNYNGQVPPTPLDDGSAFIIVDPTVPTYIGTPGSFAGSPYTNLIPPELNSWYASRTLYPSTYTVSQAIEEVVRCNCDCWQLA